MIGVDRKTLYRYADVPAAWSRADVTKLAARKTSTGLSLSWSHLVELAAVSNATKRNALLEKAFSEALSVRDLKKQVRGPKPARGDALSAGGIAAGLRELSARAIAITGAEDHFLTVALGPLAKAAELTDAEKAALAAAVERVGALQKVVESFAELLRDAAGAHQVEHGEADPSEANADG